VFNSLYALDIEIELHIKEIDQLKEQLLGFPALSLIARLEKEQEWLGHTLMLVQASNAVADSSAAGALRDAMVERVSNIIQKVQDYRKSLQKRRSSVNEQFIEFNTGKSLYFKKHISTHLDTSL
jgi:hypothetical protein